MTINLTCYKSLCFNKRFRWLFPFTLYTDTTQVTPVNLTGYTVTFVVMVDGVDIFTKVGTVATPASGFVQFIATAAEIAELPEGSVDFEIRFNLAGMDPEPSLKVDGKIAVIA